MKRAVDYDVLPPPRLARRAFIFGVGTRALRFQLFNLLEGP
jgi:hypothetical protein